MNTKFQGSILNFLFIYYYLVNWFFTNSSTCCLFICHLDLFLEQLKLIFQLFLMSHEGLEEFKERACEIVENMINCDILNGGEKLRDLIETKPSIHKNNSSKTAYSSKQSKFVSHLLIISLEVTTTREW